MYIDSHAHIEKRYYKDIDKVIIDAKLNNVGIVIINGYREATNKEIREIVRRYDNVYGAVGYHPEELEDVNDNKLELLKEQLKDPKIIAVGEIGLDYYHGVSDKDLQKEFFRKQIELAITLDKPIIVHSRDALEDTYSILKEYDFNKLRGVMHCYAYGSEAVEKFLEMNLFFGIGGIVTFKNGDNIRESVQKIDLDHILLETDAPYLTPEPYRKNDNEPKYIPLIAEKIAEVKNISVKEVEEITTNNVKRLFNISL